jgi:chemotaxis signal transduction protein
MTTMTSKSENTEGAVSEFVTAVIGGQLFGLPISRVQDVFMPERLTRVPLSSGEIAGVLNLRGRIVTVSTGAPVSACRRTTTAGRRWRWASICAVNPMAS